jgi:hypothetical protein
MKKLLLMLFITTATFAQQRKEQRFELYSYVNGVRSIAPTEVIIKYNDRVDMYIVRQGLQNITPYKTIDNSGLIFRFDNNGIREIFPTAKIEIVEPIFEF